MGSIACKNHKLLLLTELIFCNNLKSQWKNPIVFLRKAGFCELLVCVISAAVLYIQEVNNAHVMKLDWKIKHNDGRTRFAAPCVAKQSLVV